MTFTQNKNITVFVCLETTHDLIYNREIESVIDYKINQLLIIRKYNH